jgi:hypothetical protein
MHVLNLDGYLRQKEKNVVQLFVFFLNEEYSHLNSESTWLQSVKHPVYIVRMNEDEFNRMDIAIHPKIFCTKSGKELFSIDGLPTLNYLKYKVQKNLLKSV